MFRAKRIRIGLSVFGMVSIALANLHVAYAGDERGEVTLAPPNIFFEQVQKIVAIGLQENLVLRARRGEAGVADGRLRQSRLFENPVLTGQMDRRRGGMDEERMLGIELPLPIDGRRGASIKTSKAGLEEALHRVRDEERLLARSIRVAVTDVVAGRMRVELLRSSVKLAEANQNLTAESVREGMRAPLDLNREIVFVNGLRAKLEMAEIELTEFESKLSELLSRDSLEGIELPKMLPVGRLHTLSYEQVVEPAIERRPDLMASRAGIAVARGMLGEAKAEGRPRVDLMMGIRDMRIGFPFQGFDESGNRSMIEDRMRFTSIGLRIGVPIFNRNQGSVFASQNQLQAESDSATQSEIAARNEIRVSVSRFNRSGRSLELVLRGVTSQSRENLKTIRIAYNEGAISLDEFLREQRMLIETELDLIDAARLNANAEAELLASLAVDTFGEVTQTVSVGRTK